MVRELQDKYKSLISAFCASVAQSKSAYAFSGGGVVVSILTFNQIIGVLGTLIGVGCMLYTAWSNHKRNLAETDKNNAQAELARRQLHELNKSKPS